MADQKGDATHVVIMYCVKCREKAPITGPQKVRMRSNRPAYKGNCPHCGTVCHRIRSAND